MSDLRAGHVWLAKYVRSIGQTCLVKTTPVVPKTSKTARKDNIQRILVQGQYNIYMCGTWTSFEKQNIYIYIYIYTLKPFES
jgi:hypothetical protein